MLRISQYMKEIRQPSPLKPRRRLPGPVVIWNLTRRCNLLCKHCYTNSADYHYPDELNTQNVFEVMQNLKEFRVPVLILSGGEPLLRPDIFEISQKAKDMGFYVGLSSNGTLINEDNIKAIASIGYDYVGVSLDGIGKTHDFFRGKEGAFEASLKGIKLLKKQGLKVGLRYCLTQHTMDSFDDLLMLMQQEEISKLYLSHLNYSGRGRVNSSMDAIHSTTRQVMNKLFDHAWLAQEQNLDYEIVTGNNDADGVYLYHWVKNKFPEMAQHVRAKLVEWGGNSTGINIANIDHQGNVHPDTFWWHYSLGNVLKNKFSEIWDQKFSDQRIYPEDPVLKGLRDSPKKISGRCAKCQQFDICNGNTRMRAFQACQDYFAEDPGCYLSDDEIGLASVKLPNSNFNGAVQEFFLENEPINC